MKTFNKEKSIIFFLIILSILLIFFSFLTPYLFTQVSFLKTYSGKSTEIGDTIGGLMSPFIALTGVLITFLAFFIQYNANQEIYKQIKTDKTNFYIDKMIQNFSKIQESFNLESYKIYGSSIEKSITVGKNIFKLFQNELSLSNYILYKNNCTDEEEDINYKEAFNIVYYGINSWIKYLTYLKYDLKDNAIYFDIYNDFNLAFKNNDISQMNSLLQIIGFDKEFSDRLYICKNPIFEGFSDELKIYFNSYTNLLRIIFYNENLEEFEKDYYFEILDSMLSIEEENMIYLYMKYNNYFKNPIFENIYNKRKKMASLNLTEIYGFDLEVIASLNLE